METEAVYCTDVWKGQLWVGALEEVCDITSFSEEQRQEQPSNGRGSEEEHLSKNKAYNGNHFDFVVSVMNHAPSTSQLRERVRCGIGSSANHKVFPIADMEGESITKILVEGTDWLIPRLNSGKRAIIHCRFGQSRSVTLAAACLICLAGMKAGEALEYIATRREGAGPNPGFVQELRLFACWKTNPGSLIGRLAMTRSVFINVASQWRSGKTPLTLVPNEISDIEKQFRISCGSEMNEEQSDMITCRKCKIGLLNADHVLGWMHNSHGGQANHITWLCKTQEDLSIEVYRQESLPSKPSISQIAITPCHWMTSQLAKSDFKGKLSCPKCSSKIGRWDMSFVDKGSLSARWKFNPATFITASAVDGLHVIGPLLE